MVQKIVSLSACVLVLLTLLTSCKDSKLFENYTDLDSRIWHKDSIVTFNFTIDEVGRAYDLNLTTRYSLDYQFHNLYVEYRLLNEEGDLLKKSLEETILFEPKTGMPVGSGMSDIFDLETTLLNAYSFPAPGAYTISIQQYMRVAKLPEVVSVGVNVSTTKPE